jgi:hypothetical protein
VTVPLAMAEAAGAEVMAEGLVCARPSAEWAGVGGKPPICWNAACGPSSDLSAKAPAVSADQAAELQLTRAKLPSSQVAK